MKLATLNDGSRDGALFVISQNGKIAAPAGYIAPTMQSALDNWDGVKAKLEGLYKELNDNECDNPFITETVDWHSPFPARMDGSTALPISTTSCSFEKREALNLLRRSRLTHWFIREEVTPSWHHGLRSHSQTKHGAATSSQKSQL